MGPLCVASSLQLSQTQGLTTPQGLQGRLQCPRGGGGVGKGTAQLGAPLVGAHRWLYCRVGQPVGLVRGNYNHCLWSELLWGGLNTGSLSFLCWRNFPGAQRLTHFYREGDRGSERPSRTSLAVQWLRLHTCNAGVAGSIPGQGTKIPHAARHIQNEKTQAKSFPLLTFYSWPGKSDFYFLNIVKERGTAP